MEVKIEKLENKTMVVLSGRLDTTNADKFQQDIAPLMQGDAPDIEIDCTDMEYTSSQGLRMFLMLQKSVTARKGNLVMRNMKPNVKEVFDITGFSNIIRIIWLAETISSFLRPCSTLNFACCGALSLSKRACQKVPVVFWANAPFIETFDENSNVMLDFQ